MFVEDAFAPVNGASVHIGTSLVRTEALTTDGVPPAYDEDAAQRHIASMLIDPEMCASLGEHGLTHRDYVGPERLIVQAIEGCLSEGIEPGYVNVGIYLTDHHMMGGVGGFHVLTRMCGQMGLRSHGEVKRDAERVRRHSLARQLRQDHHVAAAECTADPMKVEDIFDRFTAKMLALRARTTPHFEGVGTDTIFGELSPEPYLIPDLSIGPGLPTMIAGYSHSGKTMILMDMLLDLAAGVAVWGTYAVTKPCRCLHINYDQPGRVTFDRYQRLLKPKSYDVADIEGRLEVVNRPSQFLNSPTAKPRLMRRLEGVDVCLIDSLMAALPGEKENESGMRKYIDELGEVSEATGCTILLIHHSGKPKKEEEDGPDLRMSPRGSSAIVDALDNLFHVKPDRNEPLYHIAQAKNRSAGSKVVMSIRHENGPGYIRLTMDSHEGGAGQCVAPRTTHVDEMRVLKGEVIAHLSKMPDKKFMGTRVEFSASLRRKHNLVTGAVALLHTEGKLELGKKSDPYIRSLL